MAELADAADSKSAEVHPSWGFNSPSRHHLPSYSLVLKRSFDSLMLAQDFACGLPLRLSPRSRPQNGSSSTPPPGTKYFLRFIVPFAGLGKTPRHSNRIVTSLPN